MNKSKLIAGALSAAVVVATPIIAKWEGKRNDPYRDIVGVMTVCYGETRVEMRSYSDAECLSLLQEGVSGFAVAAQKCVPALADRPKIWAAATSLSTTLAVRPFAAPPSPSGLTRDSGLLAVMVFQHGASRVAKRSEGY